MEGRKVEETDCFQSVPFGLDPLRMFLADTLTGVQKNSLGGKRKSRSSLGNNFEFLFTRHVQPLGKSAACGPDAIGIE